MDTISIVYFTIVLSHVQRTLLTSYSLWALYNLLKRTQQPKAASSVCGFVSSGKTAKMSGHAHKRGTNILLNWFTDDRRTRQHRRSEKEGKRVTAHCRGSIATKREARPRQDSSKSISRRVQLFPSSINYITAGCNSGRYYPLSH
mgnify:CR=1 FL=1